ncbi:phage shock protein C, PspC [Arthrobacter sp. Hiyo4]|nr:phage shock protein C, PspC [Arthrobacter sp. Hiyo4]
MTASPRNRSPTRPGPANRTPAAAPAASQDTPRPPVPTPALRKPVFRPVRRPLLQRQSTGQSGDFFTWVRSHGIQRGRDRWIGGVSSGIAHRMGIDPLIVRGIFIVLTLFAGIGVLLYGLAWAFLPEPDGASTSRKPAPAAGPAA